MDYRFKHTLNTFKPDENIETDRGNGDCCCEIPVFADLTSTDEWKSDTTLAYFKKAVSTDTCTFVLTKCGEANPLVNLGTVAVFPNDSLAVGYMFDWEQILSSYGQGKYTITLDYTKAGVAQTKVWGVYRLRAWSMAVVGKYVRLRSVFLSYNQKKDIDFTGSNCFDTIRVPGIFGKRDPRTEVRQLIDKGDVSVKTTRKNDNQYLLETDLIGYCISKYLLDLHLTDEDECYATEHNKKSHFYGYIDFPVVLAESAKPTYYTKERRISVVVTFGDRVKNDNSMYNGIQI